MFYEMLMRKHPDDRPAFLDTIILAARDHDWHLRRKLTDRRLLALKAAYGTSEWSRWAYLVQIIDQHCRLKWGRDVRVFQVVREDWTPPESGAEAVVSEGPSHHSEQPPPAYRKVDTAAFMQMLRDDVVPQRFQPKETRNPHDQQAWRRLMARSISGDPAKALDSLLVNRDPERPFGYDWRRLAKAMRDPGWQRYWRLKLIEDGATPEELAEAGILSPYAEQDAADVALLDRLLP
ncbi:MAG: hypothetical protein ACK4S8_14360 [Alishewanella aestuarii]